MSIRAVQHSVTSTYLLAFSTSVGLSACADPETSLSTPTLTQAIDGTLSKVIVDGKGPQSGAHYFLHVKDSDETVELAFEKPPHLRTGAELSVTGVATEHRLQVLSFSSVEGKRNSVGKAAQPLLDTMLQKTRNVGVIAVDIADQGMNVSNELLHQIVLDADNPGPTVGIEPKDKSARQYYAEVSYGAYKIRGNVEGPFAYDGSACEGGPKNASVVLRSEIETTYDNYVWYFGSVDENCGYAWGEEGSWSSPAQNTWFNGRVDGNVFSHELGHNIGLMHASTINCEGETFSDEPLGCTTDEYGSRLSIMGTGGIGHLNAIEKWYLTWFAGCNGVHVRQSGTFTLLPIELACNGIQALQIPMPKKFRTFSTPQSEEPTPAKYYYLELRTNQGLDTGTTAQVFVHVSDEIKPTTENSARTLLLDMNPTTPVFDGLHAGESYTDPSGDLTFRIESVTDEKAMVTVTMAKNDEKTTCMDGGVLIGPGPDTCDEPFEPMVIGGKNGYRTVYAPSSDQYAQGPVNGTIGNTASNNATSGGASTISTGNQTTPVSQAAAQSKFDDPNSCNCRLTNHPRTSFNVLGILGVGVAVLLRRAYRRRANMTKTA
jgi:hypothetical protein